MEGYIFTANAEIWLLFILGAIAGSFLNVVSLSLNNLEKIFKGRSACPKCKQGLRWFELIPLFSYLIQAGRCRSCKQPISLQYFLVELITGVIFIFTYLRLSPDLLWWQLLLVFITICIWIVILLHDARTMLVPMWFVSAGTVLALLYKLALGWPVFINSLIAALIVYLLLSGIRFGATKLMKQEAMGSADAGVGGMVAALCGLTLMPVMLLGSFLIGSVYGLVVASFQHKKIDKTAVPFAPALIISGWLTLLYGYKVIAWYLGYLT